MKLFIKKRGSGTPLILLHGWGFDSSIFDNLAQHLEKHFQIWQVDLPGYGNSENVNDYSLKILSKVIVNHCPNNAIYLGWSLGGLIAISIAENYPQKVKSLILVASSPSFIKQDNWKYALSRKILYNFSKQLHNDYTTTLIRFLTLQVKGSDNASKQLKILKQNFIKKNEVDIRTLNNGLSLLINSDLRKNNIKCPIYLCLGERDMLIPAKMAEQWQSVQKNLIYQIIQGAGHLPFLSHTEIFIDKLLEFLRVSKH
jgi:pimeloyl-[acyl-carrier protein] methyl ester esterase